MKSHNKMLRGLTVSLAAVAAVAAVTSVQAREPFTPAELKAQEEKLLTTVRRGFDMWYGARADMSKNGLACANCHPDAAATNPHTFPKYMTMFNKVVPLREMINWCIQNPQAGAPMDKLSDDMTSLEAYALYLYRGVAINTGYAGSQTAPNTPTSARGFVTQGTGIGFDK
jgi:thiosulfate dehydrogenase